MSEAKTEFAINYTVVAVVFTLAEYNQKTADMKHGGFSMILSIMHCNVNEYWVSLQIEHLHFGTSCIMNFKLML